MLLGGCPRGVRINPDSSSQSSWASVLRQEAEWSRFGFTSGAAGFRRHGGGQTVSSPQQCQTRGASRAAEAGRPLPHRPRLAQRWAQ